MKRIVGLFSLVVACWVTVGCLDDSITGTRPLFLSVTATPVAAAVDVPITFSYSAEGTRLLRVILNYGDGVVDTVTFPGVPVAVAGETFHSYSVSGSFTTRATIEAMNGVFSSEATVQIN